MTDIITRAQWGAAAPRGASNAINAHPDGVAVHYEGPKMGRRDHSKCAALVRTIQRFHMGPSRGWADVAYNFLVCEHGVIFEGRGIGRGSAANGTTEANHRFYAVCALVGQGDEIRPELLRGIREAVEYCQSNGAGSRVTGHRDHFATACPGDVLYKWVHAGMPVDKALPSVTSANSSIPAVFTNPAKRPASAVWGLGDEGATVASIQRAVGVADDGIFGPKTAAAVAAWQKAHGLAADGMWGPQTSAKWSSIYRSGKPAPKVTAKPKAALPAYPGLSRPSSRVSGATRAFQQRLRARGWSISVDGIHGKDTTAVIRAFQREKGLKADGIGGPATWAALWTAPVTP